MKCAACMLLAFAFVASRVWAQASQSTVTYQGVLQQNGVPIADGTHPLTFKIYDAATGGSVIQNLPVPEVQTKQGLFTALLSVPNSSFNGADRWWSVTVGGQELPRQKIASVPYAITASSFAPGNQLSVDHAERNSYAAFITNSDVGGQGLRIRASDGGGDWNLLRIDNRDGQLRFRVNADGKATMKVLEIIGGSDIAEPFAKSPESVEPKAGMVMCIDPNHPGALKVSDRPYDSAVAGVFSGANGLPVGMLLGSNGDSLTKDGPDRLPIAMAGRVWVFADEPETDPNSRIKPGDRLTTSSVPGRVMKVLDDSRAPGTVIGKAMTPVDRKTGMCLVLVNLQ